MLQQALLLADGRPLQCAQSVPLRPSGTATFHRPQHSELTDTAAAQTAPCAALGTYHALRMRCNAALLKAAIDAGDCWDVALITARQLTPVYELIYPKVRHSQPWLHKQEESWLLAQICKTAYPANRRAQHWPQCCTSEDIRSCPSRGIYQIFSQLQCWGAKCAWCQ